MALAWVEASRKDGGLLSNLEVTTRQSQAQGSLFGVLMMQVPSLSRLYIRLPKAGTPIPQTVAQKDRVTKPSEDS